MNRQLTGVMADIHFSPTVKSEQESNSKRTRQKTHFYYR